MLGCGFGCGWAARAPESRRWIGGVVIGLGVAAMHFTGMSAVELPAWHRWDLGFVAAALLLGTVLTGAAGDRAFRADAGHWRCGSTLLLTLGICSLHFVAMAAFRPEPTPFLPVPDPSGSIGTEDTLPFRWNESLSH